MRGKVQVRAVEYITHGITPAYAGKRTALTVSRKTATDHPRLCGEKILHT